LKPCFKYLKLTIIDSLAIGLLRKFRRDNPFVKIFGASIFGIIYCDEAALKVRAGLITIILVQMLQCRTYKHRSHDFGLKNEIFLADESTTNRDSSFRPTPVIDFFNAAFVKYIAVSQACS
jgi:hypothetical protein